MPKKSCNNGFTLIELLIVVAIIGLMATFFITTFVGPQKRARDGNRKSDIKQYQTALELYASKKNGLYPSRINTAGLGGAPASGTISPTLCEDLVLTNCPVDSLNSKDVTYSYRYQSDGLGSGGINATKYILWAKLETATTNNKKDWWVACSDGRSGIITDQTTFPIPTGTNIGACPL